MNKTWTEARFELTDMILENFTGEHNSYDEVMDKLMNYTKLTSKGITKEDVEEFNKIAKERIEKYEKFANSVNDEVKE